MNSPTIIPFGRETLEWIRQGGKPTRAGWSQSFFLRWQSLWFEYSRSLQNRLPPAPPLAADPVFILGLWRSGTTHLHDLLSACPGMLYPATWQCMSPASFQLQSPPARGKSVKRPMDGMTIDSLSPQEDEFALLATGVPSVYRGFFDPRRLPELTQCLDPSFWSYDRPEGWLSVWRQFLAGVADGRHGRLVLKSPNHSFRINTLAECFPGATFIWLVRDPAETYFSNRKMWIAMFERYALWKWDDSVVDEFLCKAFKYASECLLQATRLLPKECLSVVPFEHLTGKTLNILELLNDRLHLGNWREMHANIANIVDARADYRPDFYPDSRLPDIVLKATEILRIGQLRALSSHGL